MRIIVNDLLPGKEYHLQLRSKNATEESVWSRTFPVTIAVSGSKPMAPENVAIVVVGDSFKATWNEVQFSDDGSKATDLSGYLVEFRNVNTGQTARFNTTDTSFELTYNLNLAMFTPVAGTVGVKVAAKNISGSQSEWSDEAIVQNPPPGPVRNLVAESVTDAIVAKWDAPADLEDDFSEYRVYLGTDSNFTLGSPIWTGVGTNAIYNITTQVDFYFKVVAVDKFGGVSSVSTAGPVRPRPSVQIDADAPDTPTALSGNIDVNKLVVNWTPPANPDADLAGYKIGYRKAGTFDWSYATASHEDTSVAIEPIERYTDYHVRIQAHDFSFNYSDWSTMIVVSGETNTAPATPTGVVVKGAITSAMVVWDANTEEDLLGYEVQFEDHTPTNADPVFPTSGRNMSFSENVTEDTRYYARVRAVDIQGLKSGWSTVATDTVGFVDFDAIEVRLDNSITGSNVQYAVNTSETVAPASGWSTDTPTRNPGEYIWFRTVITYGDGSGSTSNPALLTGNDGAQGPQGIPGTPGDDGQSLYTWLKYADTPTSGMSDSPTGKTYIGLAYNQTTPDESTTYSDYSWSLIKGADGADGDQGVPGPPGADGESLYTWVKYAPNGNPTQAQMSDSPTGMTHIGLAYNKTVQAESDTPTDYTWALIQGPKGDQGPRGLEGPKGDDGIQYYTWIKYADTPTPTAQQMYEDPAGRTYMGIAVNKTSATESTNYLDYKWSLVKGSDGSDGKGISGTVVNYAKNTSGTSEPTSGWGTSIPATSPGEYLWTRTVTTYTDNSTSTGYSVAKHGTTGNTGAEGRGITGTTVDYTVSASGTVEPTTGWQATIPATSPGQFLWTRTVTTYSSAPTSVTSYSVAKHGETGSQGIPGEKGADGTTTYTWIKYAPNGNPSNAQMTDTPQSNTTHIGLAYNKTTATESSTATEYSWSLIQGPKGDTGDTGATGVSVTAVTPFYRKVTKGAAKPGQPSGTADPSGWTTTEPSYTANTELYRTERISYSNNTAAWTPVSKVASYDAADAAMVVAITADNRVRKANVAPVVADGANAPVGALWYEYGAATSPNTGIVLKQTWEWNGSIWQPRGIDHTFLPKVDIAEGTFGELVGNRIEADSIGALQIKTEEIAADSAFLGALEVDNANITSLEASKLTAGNGLITDLTVKSTLTIGDASNAGYIQSSNFSGTTAGWRLDKSGLTINQGSIEARALKIQSGQNLMRPEYADFEWPDAWYNPVNLTPTNFTTTAVTGGRFNKQSLACRATATGASSLYLGMNNTDYNIPVEAGKVYIVSGWFKGGPVTSAVQFRIKWSTGTESTLTTSPTSIAASAAWTRFTAVTPAAPTGSVGAILSIHSSTSAVNSGFDVDGLQVEEKIGSINTPSSWNMPGTTTIDGAMIRTGEIRSNATVSLPGAGTRPMWYINMAGGMEINSAVIRGSLTIGQTGSDSGAIIQSHNYVPGTSGFMFRGSDGYADLRNLAANTIDINHIKSGTLSADNIEAGTINVTIGINASGSIVVGSPTGGGTTEIRGGPDGGVKLFVEDQDEPASEFGKRIVTRDADGTVVTSMDDTGFVSGHYGEFSRLYVAGTDVTDRIVHTESAIVARDVVEVSLSDSRFGPFIAKTGFREVMFIAEPGRAYRIENWLHVMNSGSSAGTFFAYMTYEDGYMDGTYNFCRAPTINSEELSSNDGSISTGAEGRFYQTAYYVHDGAIPVEKKVRILVSARGGGTRSLRFFKSKFTVTDLGPYNPLVESGAFSTGGASGTPAPPVEDPPALYKSWYDMSWEQVYQPGVIANHNVGGLGAKARQGRVGSTASHPYATMFGIPQSVVNDLQGAKVKRMGMRLTSVGSLGGSVILGWNTASSRTSSPSTMALTPNGLHTAGSLSAGSTKVFYLPSSFYTVVGNTSPRAITVGRLDSNGYNDRFLEFANINSGVASRPRLYVEYEK